MEVQFYGRLRDIAGPMLEIEVPEEGCTIAELRTRLAEHPAVPSEVARASIRACVDDSIVGEDYRINEGQAVEFFPPLSGG